MDTRRGATAGPLPQPDQCRLQPVGQPILTLAVAPGETGAKSRNVCRRPNPPRCPSRALILFHGVLPLGLSTTPWHGSRCRSPNPPRCFGAPSMWAGALRRRLLLDAGLLRIRPPLAVILNGLGNALALFSFGSLSSSSSSSSSTSSVLTGCELDGAFAFSSALTFADQVRPVPRQSCPPFILLGFLSLVDCLGLRRWLGLSVQCKRISFLLDPRLGALLALAFLLSATLSFLSSFGWLFNNFRRNDTRRTARLMLG